MAKLRKDLLKTLQALQLHFDVKVSMAQDLDPRESSGLKEEEGEGGDFAASFLDFVERVMIEPFGGRLYQSVHDIAIELDLPEATFSRLKEKAGAA